PRTGHQPTAPPQPPSTLPCGPPHGTNPPHPSRDRDRDPLGSGTRLRPAGTTHHQTAPHAGRDGRRCAASTGPDPVHPPGWCPTPTPPTPPTSGTHPPDRKSTRLNSSHVKISY